MDSINLKVIILRFEGSLQRKFFEVLNSDCFLNTVGLGACVCVRCADAVQLQPLQPISIIPHTTFSQAHAKTGSRL